MIPNTHCETDSGTAVTNLELEITQKCPLACSYCFRARLGRNRAEERSMTLDVAQRGIDWLLRACGDANRVSVWFMGGEPLVEFELIKQAVEYGEAAAKTAGKKITFGATTNLVLINEEVMAFWREHNMTWNSSVDGAPDSQDACRVFPDGTGSASVVERKIPLVLGHRAQTSARASISPQTAPNMRRNAEYLLAQGYQNLAMVPVEDEAWAESDLQALGQGLAQVAELFLERYRRGQPFGFKLFDSAFKAIGKPERRQRPCGAGAGMLYLDTQAQFWPCHRFPGYDPEGAWVLGNLGDGLDDAKRSAFLALDCRRDTQAECDRCLAVHTCGMGCVATNWFANHDLRRPVALHCRVSELAFREALRVYYLLRSESNPLFLKRYVLNGKAAKPKAASAGKGRAAPVRLPRLSCGVV